MYAALYVHVKVNKVIERFFTKAQQKTRMDHYRPLKIYQQTY